jgi:tetratricopeptide (TPR) repeat protein
MPLKVVAMMPGYFGTAAAHGNRMRAVCRLGLRTYEAALSDIRKALSLAPDSNISFVEWQTLAEAEFGLGNLDAARKASQMAVARNQKFVWSLLLLAVVQGELEDRAAACKVFDIVYRLVDDFSGLIETDLLRRYDISTFEKLSWTPPAFTQACNDNQSTRN